MELGILTMTQAESFAQSDYDMTGNGEGAPPYISFKTLITFLQDLREHDIPNKVDRSILHKFSGSVGTQLMTALRWLDLVNDHMVPTPHLKELVEAYESPKWQPTLESVLRRRYKFAFDLDLERATPAQFSAAFRQFSGKDEVLAKCRRFFLQAAESAGIQVNARLKQRAKLPPRPRKRLKDIAGYRTETPSRTGENSDNEQSSEGAIQGSKLPSEILLSLFDPNEMGDEEQAAIWTLLKHFKAKGE